MAKHQLEHGMACKIENDDQLRKIYRAIINYKFNYIGHPFANSTYLYAYYTLTPEISISFHKNSPCYEKLISFDELLARLKGEWYEPLEIEIGKVYESKNGARILIIFRNIEERDHSLCFAGIYLDYIEHCLLWYSKNGICANMRESDDNLIKLSPDQSHNIELIKEKEHRNG